MNSGEGGGDPTLVSRWIITVKCTRCRYIGGFEGNCIT